MFVQINSLMVNVDNICFIDVDEKKSGCVIVNYKLACGNVITEKFGTKEEYLSEFDDRGFFKEKETPVTESATMIFLKFVYNKLKGLANK